MAETENNDGQPDSGEQSGIDGQDLDLIDDALEDEGKSEAELWDEIEAAEAGDDAGGAPDNDAGAATGDDTATAGDDTDQGAASPEPDGDGTPSGDDGDDAGEEDPFANATPEQKTAFNAVQAELDRYKQSDRSQRGRVGSLQRRINELLAAQSPADEAGDDGGDSDELVAIREYLASDELAEWKEEYPEMAGPISKIAKLVETLDSRVTQQGQQIQAANDSRNDDLIDEQEILLAHEHSDWQDVAAAEDFGLWLEKQPRYVKEAAVRNAKSIVDAEEAADLISRFKADRSEGSDGGPEDTSDAGGDDANGKGDGTTRLSGRRQRQLESAASSRAGGAGAADGIPENASEEEIWDAMERLDQRQAKSA